MKNSKIFLALISGILGLGVLGYFLIKILLSSSKYSITSWWRTPAYNQEVGGVSNSMHLVGLAYDVSPKPSEAELSKFWFFRTKIRSYPNHIHLGWVG